MGKGIQSRCSGMGGGKLKPLGARPGLGAVSRSGVEGRRLLQKLPDIGTFARGKHGIYFVLLQYYLRGFKSLKIASAWRDLLPTLFLQTPESRQRERSALSFQRSLPKPESKPIPLNLSPRPAQRS